MRLTAFLPSFQIGPRIDDEMTGAVVRSSSHHPLFSLSGKILSDRDQFCSAPMIFRVSETVGIMDHSTMDIRSLCQIFFVAKQGCAKDDPGFEPCNRTRSGFGRICISGYKDLSYPTELEVVSQSIEHLLRCWSAASHVDTRDAVSSPPNGESQQVAQGLVFCG